MNVSILSPPTAAIGRYKLSLQVTSGNKVHTHLVGQFIMLFNPWCSGESHRTGCLLRGQPGRALKEREVACQPCSWSPTKFPLAHGLLGKRASTRRALGAAREAEAGEGVVRSPSSGRPTWVRPRAPLLPPAPQKPTHAFLLSLKAWSEGPTVQWAPKRLLLSPRGWGWGVWFEWV